MVLIQCPKVAFDSRTGPLGALRTRQTLPGAGSGRRYCRGKAWRDVPRRLRDAGLADNSAHEARDLHPRPGPARHPAAPHRDAPRSADGGPQAALIGFGVTDQFELVFDTLRSTRKAVNLEGNPRVALVIGGWGDGG